MRIDSVREVKRVAAAWLGERVAEARVAGVRTARAGAMAAVALGVAPSGRGFRLAVRVPPGVPASVVRGIKRLARGEAEVYRIGGPRAMPPRREPASGRDRRERPLTPGCSIGPVERGELSAGTLGFFARDRHGRTVLVTNCHVVAGRAGCPRGAAVLQPGMLDGGEPARDAVAAVTRAVRVRRAPARNRVDAAAAALRTDQPFEPGLAPGVGPIRGVAPAPMSRVVKLGRTTGVTRGRVTAFELDNLHVEYDFGEAVFDGQLEIAGEKAFGRAGDSGALVLGEDGLAVGMIFACVGGRTPLTYANPMRDVLDALGVEMLTASTTSPAMARGARVGVRVGVGVGVKGADQQPASNAAAKSS